MAKKKALFKETLGVDIGSHSIKAVYLRRTGEGYRLLNAGIRTTVPDGVEYTPSDLRPDRYSPQLSDLLRSMHINPRKIRHLVTSVGGDNTAIKQIKTIYLPDEELESALFFEAKKHLPISGSDMVLDYQVLGIEEKTNNMHILLAAATKDLLTEHTQVLADSNFTPGVVDVEALALANCFIMNMPVDEGVFALVNIGAHKSNLVIWGSGAKFFARDIPWGGFNFTRDIMDKLDMPFEQADVYKKENDVKTFAKASGSALSLDITEKSTQEQLATEIRRSLRFYVKEASNSDFKKVFLAGGSSKIAGLADYFAETLNIPCEVFNPCMNVDVSSRFEFVKDPQYALALGLAMRQE